MPLPSDLPAEVAGRFDVSAWTVHAWRRRRDRTGSVAPSPRGGGQKPALDEALSQAMRQITPSDARDYITSRGYT